MKIIDHPDQLGRLPHPLMAIGVFDGIHLGHQAVLRSLVKRSRESQGTSILLTFHPHPQKVISPPDAPLLLLTFRQKEEMLAQLDIDIIVRLPFTRELSLRTPEQFAQTILRGYGIREIHVGTNFRFGRDRCGDFQMLRSLGGKFQFQVYETEPVCFRNLPVSSTRIRTLLREGRVSLARRLLNRRYQIRGTVVRGARRGVEIGFPTANVEPENELIPANGVYAGQAHVNGVTYTSVTNIGYRPTLHEHGCGRPVVETHLLGFEGTLYGKLLIIDFCLRLRPEKKFDSALSLRKQIERDVGVTRKYLAKVYPWQSA